jgi:hypothetical protein
MSGHLGTPKEVENAQARKAYSIPPDLSPERRHRAAAAPPPSRRETFGIALPDWKEQLDLCLGS